MKVLRFSKALLERIGMRLARSPWSAVLFLAFRMLQLRLRGLGFREREESQIAREELVRIDTCWSVAHALSLVDTIRAREFQIRHLLLSLKAGEPYRVARALGNEAGLHGAERQSNPQTNRTARHRRALALARRVRNPHALGIVQLGAVRLGPYGWTVESRAGISPASARKSSGNSARGRRGSSIRRTSSRFAPWSSWDSWTSCPIVFRHSSRRPASVGICTQRRACAPGCRISYR